jgi:arylsulfatase A-like enzyme
LILFPCLARRSPQSSNGRALDTFVLAHPTNVQWRNASRPLNFDKARETQTCKLFATAATKRAADFIRRNASAGKPFFAYVSFSLMHMPTLPNPEFAGKTGNGDWADCLAEMDYRTGQIIDAIKQAGIEDNTLVIFTSERPRGDPPLGR